MHTSFNFAFYYPVMQSQPARQRNGGVEYVHVIDLLIKGTGTKWHLNGDSQVEPYSFEIEEVIAENDNIFLLLEQADGLGGIKAACMHHVKQVSFGQRTTFRMSYLPLKNAI